MISIIIPIYNIADCVHYSIESVLNQTYSDFELILVNDGSTDNSLEIVSKYAINNKKVKLVDKKNGGLSSARNAGIDIAIGEYILFLDGDDYYHPMTLEILNQIRLDNDNPDFIQFAYSEVTDYNYTFTNISNVKSELITDKYLMYDRLLFLGGIGASACTKLIKRELVKDIRFKEGIIHEDEFFTTRLINISQRVVYTDINLYQYVVRQNSIVHQKFSQKKLDSIVVIEDRIQLLKDLGYDDLVLRNYERLFNICIILYYSAKDAKNKTATQFIKNIIKKIVRIKKLKLSGIPQLVYRYPFSLSLLYKIRKIKKLL